MSWKPLWTIHTSLVEGAFQAGFGRRSSLPRTCHVRRGWRGRQSHQKAMAQQHIPDFQDKLEEEIGDVFAYLTLLSLAYDLRSPSRILDEVTLPKIKARWPEHFKPSSP